MSALENCIARCWPAAKAIFTKRNDWDINLRLVSRTFKELVDNEFEIGGLYWNRRINSGLAIRWRDEQRSVGYIFNVLRTSLYSKFPDVFEISLLSSTVDIWLPSIENFVVACFDRRTGEFDPPINPSYVYALLSYGRLAKEQVHLLDHALLNIDCLLQERFSPNPVPAAGSLARKRKYYWLMDKA